MQRSTTVTASCSKRYELAHAVPQRCQRRDMHVSLYALPTSIVLASTHVWSPGGQLLQHHGVSDHSLAEADAAGAATRVRVCGSEAHRRLPSGRHGDVVQPRPVPGVRQATAGECGREISARLFLCKFGVWRHGSARRCYGHGCRERPRSWRLRTAPSASCTSDWRRCDRLLSAAKGRVSMSLLMVCGHWGDGF